MDVTRDSSPRPAPRPAGPPDPAAGGPGGPGSAGSTAATGKAQPARATSGGLTAPAPGTAARAALPEDPPTRELTPVRAEPDTDNPATRRPPRVDQALRERHAFALPGWLALLVLLLGTAGLLAVLVRAGVVPEFEALPDIRTEAVRRGGPAGLTGAEIAAVASVGLLLVAVLAGLLSNPGGEARVLTRWGRYRGTVRRAGLLWVNPLVRRRRVDVRLRHWRSDPVTVTDRTGTPIVVRLLVVWRVRDTARAVLSVAEHEAYLREQIHAVLSRTASRLPCDSDAGPGPALRDGQWFADELSRALAAEAHPAGLEVYSAQPIALDYAPEVAESMRRRRLADLDAGLRTVLVDDAVEAAALAVRRLERATAHQLDEAARSALMEQLLVAFVAPVGVVGAPVPAPAARPARKEGAGRTEGRPA
ncbi:regulator of protease activity HflC (stomatin/prohibitin superfamily) [Streptomyces sp. TLI_235]|nr:SPFH domain-containing protein [Streptomyces sp. TLI_235]PBC78812.1 regulator of protease activity HflC (stomatin/prohibitin superfamily) [Streptomyces sp. TLI_235]